MFQPPAAHRAIRGSRCRKTCKWSAGRPRPAAPALGQPPSAVQAERSSAAACSRSNFGLAIERLQIAETSSWLEFPLAALGRTHYHGPSLWRQIMRRTFHFVVLLICSMVPSSSRAQIMDSTVCDILANPQSYNGKIVRIKGIVIAGFEEFAVKGSGCNQAVNALWLAYPEGTKGKAGPAAFLGLQLAKNHPSAVTNISRPPITIDKNKDFKKF